MVAESSAPTISQVYTWEPSNSAIARRYGLRSDQILRFDTNTSPNPPARLSELLRGPWEPPLNEYPDSSYADLAGAAADYVGAHPDEIVVGAGADEVLELVAKAFLSPGAAAAVPVPTYGMYAVLSSQRGARVIEVPRSDPEEGYALDLDALGQVLPECRVVWACAPNNPTGVAEPPGRLEALLEAAGADRAVAPPIVVVDEAYHEFTGQTWVGLRERYPFLVVVRTLSKAFALAGIRVGYAVAARETIAALERVRPPGSISTISAQLAAAALRRPQQARARVGGLHAGRDRLAAGLREAGWAPLPSVTNFLLVRFPGGDAARSAAERLLRSGIVPRTFPEASLLSAHLRLTVRSEGENARLLEVIGS